MDDKRNSAQAFVVCDNLIKIYQVADLEVVALQGLNLEVAPGEMLALVGPSGSGKSTLLNVLGCLDTPSAGSVSVAGRDLVRMKEPEQAEYKRHVVGFFWQQPSRNLLPYLSALENVELPMQLAGARAAVRRRAALDLLDVVGLADRAAFRPDRLSGGEQQRVGLAVALANKPSLLLADEPTGQVDSAAAAQVLDALCAANQAYGTTAIIVTHDPRVASRMRRVVTIRDGRTSTEVRRRLREDGSLDEEEWVILDPVGRLQLPRASLSALEMREWVRLQLEPDHISVWPNHEGGRQARGGAPEALSIRTWTPVDENQPLAGDAVVTEGLSRAYESAGEPVYALREVTLGIPAGSLSVIKGPSGSGKTTLLNLIAGLDEPTAGAARLGELSPAEMSPQERIDLCRQRIGFVFQTFGLLPFLSVAENVEVPLRLLSTPAKERRSRVAKVLERVGLADRAGHRTYELSGGEQQRVAIARALVKRPGLILADEPTGELDTLTGAAIVALLREIADQTGVTVIVASHDPSVQEAADLVFELRDGRLVATVDRRDRTSARRS